VTGAKARRIIFVTVSAARVQSASSPGDLGLRFVFAADSGRSGALIPFEVGQRSVAMWGRIPLGSGALFGL